MNIFSDLHHSGLYYSLHLLFEKRLGFNLYRPLGMEWFNKGYWDIAKPYQNNINTVKQYLLIKDNYLPVDGSPPLNRIVEPPIEASYYKIYDTYHDYEEKAITFQQFLDMDIDIIIASIPDHWETYTRLRDKFKPKAKVICQMGNMFNEVQYYMNQGVIKNLMASTIDFPASVNHVFYHQEQPVVEFEATPSGKYGVISSFAHLFPRGEIFNNYKEFLPQFTWEAYGASSPNGWMPTLAALYDKVQESSFVWHVKPGGDGYGWNWHTAFMMGRPVITVFDDYKDKLGGKLFEHNITGIDLDSRNILNIRDLLIDIVKSGRLQEMQRAARKRWEEVVNYDDEQKKIETFLHTLQ